MTIKTKLLTAFSVLVSLVVLMGTALVVFGLQNWKLSGNRVTQYSRLFFWREISQSYEAQWRDLNYYMILGDQSEKERSRDQAALIRNRVDGMTPKWEELEKWYSEYRLLNDAVDETMDTGSREDLFRKFSQEFSGREAKLKDQLQRFIEYHTGMIQNLEQRINNINTFGIIFSVVMGIISIITGSLMSYFIYRSISVPLGALQDGVRRIGEGDMEHKLKVEAQDEIGRLAKGFNQMVDNLRTMQMQIMQMDRMSSIGQLAGGVAHEINNPLTGVLGQSQLLLEKLPKGDPCRYNVERIESAAQRCRNIVRALLDFARDKNYNFSVRSIAKLIDETLEFTKSEIDMHNIRVIKDIPGDLPQVKVSAGHIQQVFLNIINNAAQSMGKEGTLTISARTAPGFIIVSFADTGKGIKKEHVGHVFDPFFTTKDVGQGTGLGLTISYGIMQKHEGEISVTSEGENRGATFTVKLPVRQDAQS